MRALIHLFYDEIAEHFKTDDLSEYLEELIQRKDTEKLKKFIAFVEELSNKLAKNSSLNLEEKGV